MSEFLCVRDGADMDTILRGTGLRDRTFDFDHTKLVIVPITGVADNVQYVHLRDKIRKYLRKDFFIYIAKRFAPMPMWSPENEDFWMAAESYQRAALRNKLVLFSEEVEKKFPQSGQIFPLDYWRHLYYTNIDLYYQYLQEATKFFKDAENSPRKMAVYRLGSYTRGDSPLPREWIDEEISFYVADAEQVVREHAKSAVIVVPYFIAEGICRRLRERGFKLRP